MIVPEAPSFSTQFARSLGGGLSSGISKGAELVGEMSKQKSKFAQEFQVDAENYTKIKDAFGQNFAEIWRASPTGARTELTKAALEARARGIDLDQVLTGSGAAEQTEPLSKPISSKVAKPKESVPDYNLDVSGMTPKEKVKYKSELRGENTKIWKEAVDKKKNYSELSRDIKTLDNLNERKNLPEGFGKLLINPETGAPYDLATAVKDMHPDVQRWVKTIARQATQAQSSFPGRVTNFDLMNYMRQFPSLFNTYDGRKVILKQMELTNQAHELLEDALDKVYSKYKLSGITPEDAYSMSHDMVKDKIADIDEKLIHLSDEGEQLASPKKDTMSSRIIDVIGPDGQEYEIDESEVEMLPEGFRIK